MIRKREREMRDTYPRLSGVPNEGAWKEAMAEVTLKAGTEFVPVNEAVRLIAHALCPVSDEEHALFVELHRDKEGKIKLSAEAKEHALNARNARINVQNEHYHRIVGLIQSGELPAISIKTRIPTRALNDSTVLTKDEYEGYLRGLRITLSFEDVEVGSVLQAERKSTEVGIPLPNLRLDEWPLTAPKGVEPLSAEQLRGRLSSADREAKYLLPARVMKGSKGKNGASAWNPARLANILTTRNDMIAKQAETMIADLFPDYLEEWKRLREIEDTYSDK